MSLRDAICFLTYAVGICQKTRRDLYRLQASGTSLYRNRTQVRLYRIYISQLPQGNYIAKGVNSMDKTIKELAVELTVEITYICESINGRKVFTNQLLRSCSSIGANAHEAKYAQSKADFVSKMEIALKECYETEYWLEILFKTNTIDEKTYTQLQSKCGSIRRKLIASVTTAKANKN